MRVLVTEDCDEKGREGYGTLVNNKLMVEGVPLSTVEIALDSGETIFGYECWWVPISSIKDRFKIAIEEKYGPIVSGVSSNS